MNNMRNKCIHIKLRTEFLLNISKILKGTGWNLPSFIRTLVEQDCEFIGPDSQQFHDAAAAIEELNSVGVMLNRITFQINANIKKRSHLKREFLEHFNQIVDRAVRCFYQFRFANPISMRENLSLSFPSFQVQNSGHLQPHSPRRIPLSTDEKKQIISLAEEHGCPVNNLINRLLNCYFMQGNFHDDETRILTASFVMACNRILVNLNQIAHNKLKRAFAEEITVATALIDGISQLVFNLNSDPILRKGRSFSVPFAQFTADEIRSLHVA